MKMLNNPMTTSGGRTPRESANRHSSAVIMVRVEPMAAMPEPQMPKAVIVSPVTPTMSLRKARSRSPRRASRPPPLSEESWINIEPRLHAPNTPPEARVRPTATMGHSSS
jgi:hypothetical protein